MRILLYAPGNKDSALYLQKMIEDQLGMRDCDIYYDIFSLSQALRQPSNAQYIVAVLIAAKKQDLDDLIKVQDLLRDLRVILVLPDREKDTVAKGHSFRPRFLSYSDSDFNDIVAVLEKCLESCSSKRS